MMKLLYTKRSPYARKPRIIALEKGIDLELVDEDLAHKSQRLLDANPLGKVPTLILDDGTTVYDSRVICQYLDSLNDRMVMIPPSGLKRIEVLKWEALADDLATLAINVYMERVRHPQDFHKNFVALGQENIQVAFSYIEKNLSRLGQFNLAVVAIVSALGYVHFRLPDLKAQGKLLQWFESLHARLSIAQTVPVA